MAEIFTMGDSIAFIITMLSLGSNMIRSIHLILCHVIRHPFLHVTDCCSVGSYGERASIDSVHRGRPLLDVRIKTQYYEIMLLLRVFHDVHCIQARKATA